MERLLTCVVAAALVLAVVHVLMRLWAMEESLQRLKTLQIKQLQQGVALARAPRVECRRDDGDWRCDRDVCVPVTSPEPDRRSDDHPPCDAFEPDTGAGALPCDERDDWAALPEPSDPDDGASRDGAPGADEAPDADEEGPPSPPAADAAEEGAPQVPPLEPIPGVVTLVIDDRPATPPRVEDITAEVKERPRRKKQREKT